LQSQDLETVILSIHRMLKKFLLLLLLIPVVCDAQTLPYQDLSYDSKVFGQARYYRLLLPDGYQQSAKRYPVIYFFHGYTGRYNKEPNVKPDYDLLGKLVNKYQVIMVMWDGNYEESNPAPYNVGGRENVKYQVQVKDYFLEFIGHIDSNYRTLANRNHRGIIGFSMGGFTSMFIAGKYPDKVSAITNMVGSPEFFVGYPDNQTFFPHRYLTENMKDVSVRMHNMDGCALSLLNNEIKNGALWEGLPTFEYWMGHGSHEVDKPGEAKLFEAAIQSVVNRFHDPVPLRNTWSHYDLYSEFSVWDYTVKSDKDEPGFLYLRNVSPAGFGFYSYQWIPDGPPISRCTAIVTTAPIYKKGTEYDILTYLPGATTPVLSKEKADREGRLHIPVSGAGCEVSISHRSQRTDFVVSQQALDKGKRYIRVNEQNEINLTILQRGGDAAIGKKVRVAVTCVDPTVLLYNAIQEITIDRNGRIGQTLPIGIVCSKMPPADGSPPWIKLNVRMSCDNENFSDDITVPVFFDVPSLTDIRIDDGRLVSDQAKQLLGTGNGNGVAEASEQVMLYEKDHRLRLFTDDPYIETASEQSFYEVLPGGAWQGDGFTLTSIVKVADNCPPGHTVEFLANYETKTRMPIGRVVHWGKVKMTVSPSSAAKPDVEKFNAECDIQAISVKGANMKVHETYYRQNENLFATTVEVKNLTDRKSVV